MNQNSVATAGNRPVASPSDAPGVLRPRVEVVETKDGITLRADLPGVSRDNLKVQVEQNTLAIEGLATLPFPENLQPLHTEVRNRLYRRSFTLSQELDVSGIHAALADGVLELHIPKRAEVRPRRIEVQAA